MIGTARHDRWRDFEESIVAPRNVSVPLSLVVLSGLPATGKSTVARAIALATGLPIIGSDEVRTRLFPVRTYSVDETEEVYDRCRRLARLALSSGKGAIVDATNLYEDARRLWRKLARDYGAAFIIVIVEAPAEVVTARMASRALVPDPAFSEATLEVYKRLSHQVEPSSLPHLLFRPSNPHHASTSLGKFVVAETGGPDSYVTNDLAARLLKGSYCGPNPRGWDCGPDFHPSTVGSRFRVSQDRGCCGPDMQCPDGGLPPTGIACDFYGPSLIATVYQSQSPLEDRDPALAVPHFDSPVVQSATPVAGSSVQIPVRAGTMQVADTNEVSNIVARGYHPQVHIAPLDRLSGDEDARPRSRPPGHGYPRAGGQTDTVSNLTVIGNFTAAVAIRVTDHEASEELPRYDGRTPPFVCQGSSGGASPEDRRHAGRSNDVARVAATLETLCEVVIATLRGGGLDE